jgi:hypothetical protein
MTVYFIDEYRLIGTIRPDRMAMLVLWDSSDDCPPRDLPVLVFEPRPYYLPNNVDRNLRNHTTNRADALPFRESPSMGVAAFSTYAIASVVSHALVIPVKTLVGFARRIGTAERVPWMDWLHFATPVELPLVFPLAHILHSHILSVRRAEDSVVSTSILQVCDFSLHSRRRKIHGDPSAQLPPYTVQEFPFDVTFHGSTFDFTEGGILVTYVRV